MNPAPDPLHYIDLKHGMFDKTSPNDLDKAFDNLVESESSDLRVFFHGASSRAQMLLRRRAPHTGVHAERRLCVLLCLEFRFTYGA